MEAEGGLGGRMRRPSVPGRTGRGWVSLGGMWAQTDRREEEESLASFVPFEKLKKKNCFWLHSGSYDLSSHAPFSESAWS